MHRQRTTVALRPWCAARGALLAMAVLTLPSGVAAQDASVPTLPVAASPPVRATLTTQAPTNGGRLDDIVGRVETLFAPDRLGFFPWVGSVMGGGGLAGGGGYRHEVGRGIRMDGLAGISVRNYKLLDGGVLVPLVGERRLTLDVRARLIDAPQVRFFGVGNDSSDEQSTRYDYEPKRVAARLTFRPDDRTEIGGAVGVLDIGTGIGRGGPTITSVFAPADVPGVEQSARYRTLGLFVEADRRDVLDFARRGGWYRADWQVFADGAGRGFGHQRLDLEARRFFPIIGERHAAVARAVFTGTNATTGDIVPHFMMPPLGGAEDLRGFANQRFVDRHRLLAQGEYRFRLNEMLHLAGFLDLGRVGSRLGDLSLGGLHPSVGGGIRFQTRDGFALRADVARSSEQWAFMVSNVVF